MKRYPLLACALFLMVGCSQTAPVAEHDDHDHEAESGHEEGKVELSKEAQEIAGVETHVVQPANMQEVLQVAGTVNSTDKGRAVVTAPVAGRVVSLFARLGDSVRQGQTLASIESPELSQTWSTIAEMARLRDAAKSDVQQARAEVELARAKVLAAKQNLNRQRQLAQAGAFSQAPVQKAQSDLNEAQSELLSAQEEQASHAAQLRKLEALFRDGIVSKFELEAARLESQQDVIRLNRAKSAVASAKETFEREESIASRGLLNARELQGAETEVRSSELELNRAYIRLRAAESALASAQKGISNAQAVYRSNAGAGAASVGHVALVAPISGTITHVDVTKGQAVDRTVALMEIENLTSVWVTANIPEQDSARVRKGARVRITVAALPGKEFEGVVQVVGTRVDPKTRCVPAQCLVGETGGQLKPDMFATVYVGTGAVSEVLAIPMTAIVREDDKAFVFVKEGEGFVKRAIETSIREGNRLAVVSGLKAGDIIASKGAFVLASESVKDELKGHDH